MEKQPRKRNRVPISCVICRRRKVKCDKQKPQCQNCIKNNVQHLCHYLEPKWAHPSTPPPQNDELNDKNFNQFNDDKNIKSNITNSTANDKKIEKELEKQRQREKEREKEISDKFEKLNDKLKQLETENSQLKDQIKSKKETSNNISTSTVTTIPSTLNPLSSASSINDDELLDVIFNSNILFIANKNIHYNIPITYQTSVFSWMFIVKNDLYLNDLWLKILKLRHQYEYYYNSKNSLDKNMLSHYKNYNNKYKISSLTSIIPNDKTSEHTSKLKKFLENSLKLHNTNNTNNVNIKTPNQNSDSNEIEILDTKKNDVKLKSHNLCPVTGVIGVCPIGNNVSTIANTRPQSSPLKKERKSKLKTPTISSKSEPNSTSINSRKTIANDSVDMDNGSNILDVSNSSKISPLMTNDPKLLFKEKLSKMNISSIRSSYSSPAGSPSSSSSKRKIPIIPSAPSTPLSEINPMYSDKLNNFVPIAMKPDLLSSRQNSNKRTVDTPEGSNTPKRLKSISPITIKSINYNNTKQVLSIIEQYLPNKKIVGLLVDRFFDKLYINMPYVDEISFKNKIYSIINNTNYTSDAINESNFNSAFTFNNNKIKLNLITTQYSDEFLNLCLLLIIIRLSWLSLPETAIDGLSQNELLLMKPENFISFVLVDLVKEIFANLKLLSKPSIIIFQVGMYLKIYATLSPEDGFDTDDSHTKNNNSSTKQTDANSSNSKSPDSNEILNMNSSSYISNLVQLAYTIGLNRDPLNFKNFYSNANDDKLTISKLFRKRHLWRKLWYGLLFITIEANLSLGDYTKGLPIELDLDPTLGNSINKTWDCRLPGGIEQGILEKIFESNKLLQRELCIVQNFKDSIVLYKWIYKGMKLLFVVDAPPKINDIKAVIDKLNELVSETSKHGFSIDLIMGEGEIVNPFSAKNSSVWIKKYSKQIKIMRLKVHLIVKNMIFTLNYLLFVNHEQKLGKLLGQKKNSVEKIKKQHKYIETFFESSFLLSIENFKFFIQFMDTCKDSFSNYATELMVYPYLMILNHRSHEFLISLILRIQQNSPIVIEILKKNKIDSTELQKRLFTYLETFIERLEILTKNYYYAWVLKRLVKFFYNILTNSQKIFRLNFKKIGSANGKTSPPKANTRSKVKTPVSKVNSTDTTPDTVMKTEPIVKHDNELKSAFEIAFGTSKLPPVTDFTQNHSREINFNPIISNSDIIDNPVMNLQPIQNYEINESFNNLELNSDMQMNLQMNMAAQNATNQFQIQNQINESLEVNRLMENLSNSIPTNLDNSFLPITTSNNNMWNTSLANDPTMIDNKTGNSIVDSLPEIFDDDFLHDIGGLGAGALSNNIVGVNRGLSSDNYNNQNTNNNNMFLMNNVSNNNRKSNMMGNGMNKLVELDSTNNKTNNMLFNTLFQNQVNNEITNGEMYNSLNEIDFTNVDLNTPVDNLVYNFELGLENPQNSNINRKTNKATPDGDSALNNWNFL